jgi:hypothetical protein
VRDSDSEDAPGCCGLGFVFGFLPGIFVTARAAVGPGHIKCTIRIRYRLGVKLKELVVAPSVVHQTDERTGD